LKGLKKPEINLNKTKNRCVLVAAVKTLSRIPSNRVNGDLLHRVTAEWNRWDPLRSVATGGTDTLIWRRNAGPTQYKDEKLIG
jgi:hypothetical protein